MKSQNIGFLEALYSGDFRPELCFHDFARVNEERVAEFLERFRRTMEEIDHRKLEAAGTVSPELLQRLRETGMFGLIIPTEYGGLGFTLSEYLRAIEGMAGADMALTLIPLAHLSIGIKGLLLFGTADQKRKYLPRAASGEMIFSYALTEPNVGSDAQHIETEAKLSEDGSHYVLNGTKTYITNGNYAGGFTVFAQLDSEHKGNMAAFIVERGWEGVRVGSDMPKMGLKISSTTMVRFQNVQVPRENLLGEPGDGFKIAMQILTYGRLALGASSAGGMKQSFEDMLERSGSRKQFGVPIATFELVQEKYVRAIVHGFAAAAMTYFTAALLERDPLLNCAIESSHCKLYGTTRCWDTLYDAMQLAGGAGYLSTQPYEKRMRDFRVTTIFEGTTEIHSIYPPLSVFRQMAKELSGKHFVSRLLFLRRIGSLVALRRARVHHPVLRTALAVAAMSERLYRKMLRSGLMRYGKSIVNREFYLRRMTSLSLSLFWLVASVAFVKGRYHHDAYPREELELVAYLIEEAREVQRSQTRSRTTRAEAAHRRIARTAVSEEAGQTVAAR